MAFVPVPSGIKIAVEYSLNGQLVVNVYYVTTTNPIITANLTALCDIFINWWSTNQRPNFTTSMFLERVVATDVSVPDGLQVVRDVSPPVAGTATGATAPNNVAIVLSKRTGFSGRSYRGRTYYAGIAAAEVADNILSSALVTALLVDATALSAALGSAGYTWVVASFQENGVPRTTAVTKPITSFTMDSRIDTQRRRLPGSGE